MNPSATGGHRPPSSACRSIFHLINDPKEEHGAIATPNGWAAGAIMKIVGDFEESLQRFPPIQPGTPDPYAPRK